MVSQTEWSLINNAQFLNEDRLSRSREYVGVLYFLLALAMLQTSLLCGAVQGYVLPLRRFYRLNMNLVNNKVSTSIHCVIVAAIYFIVTGAAGASGYIFMSCLLGLWLFLMLVYIAVRKILQFRQQQLHAQQQQELGAAGDGGSHDFSQGGGGGGGGPLGTRRVSTQGGDLHTSASFDIAFDSQSFDQVSLGSNDVQALKSRMKKLTKAYGSWTACPKPMGTSQLVFTLMMVLGAVIVVCIFVGVFFGWKVKSYYVVDDNRLAPEYQPELNGKSLQMLYAFPGIATQFHFQLYVRLFTMECGKKYTKTLTSNADKKKKIYDDWIQPYGINMSLFVPSDYTAYNTVDEWFTRAIDASFRPLPSSEIAIVSPADSRLLVFEQSTDMTFFLKGYTFSITTLLDSFSLDGYPSYFDNAAIAVARLAPQDYHRFHSPVSGTIISVKRIGGTYWSVSADAVRSGNDAFLNARTVVVIDAGPRLGYVAFVGIGATCVGSVQMDLADVTVGAEVVRGQPLGSMHFGGSTVMLLFSKGRIVFDQVMLQRSRYGVETLVNVNSEIGASR